MEKSPEEATPRTHADGNRELERVRREVIRSLVQRRNPPLSAVKTKGESRSGI